MFAQAESDNATFTWILRGVGYMIMAIGFMLILSPLAVIADVVPFIGDIIGAGTAFVAFIVSGCFSLITIATAWVAYRPIVGIPLLLLAGGLIAYLFMRKAKSNASRAGGGEPSPA